MFQGYFFATFLFHHIQHIAAAGEWGAKENCKLHFERQGALEGLANSLKAENQKDRFSKGIMHKWYVLQAHNSL